MKRTAEPTAEMFSNNLFVKGAPAKHLSGEDKDYAYTVTAFIYSYISPHSVLNALN